MLSDKMLEMLYKDTIAVCSECGRILKTTCGEPLGRYFVLDKHGNYYCAECDIIFDDVDDRIFCFEEDEE